jgi:putative SOS response-associated peptidase YedK
VGYPTGKQPYYFTRRDGQPITIAAIWDEWTDRETSERIKSCTMIITAANDFVAGIHDRMPAILEAGQLRRLARPIGWNRIAQAGRE